MRRRVAFGVLLAALVLLATVTQGWAFTTAPLWSFLVLAALAAAAAATSSFVPSSGEGLLARLRGSCAVVDVAATVAGAGVALTSARDGGTASLALVLAGFALVRRLTTPQGCGPAC
ncbi:hypothetical protein GCM10009721_18350 [Terrabacter tumescens]|uniref:Uncharacterized protein n=1 Tax=Terrabacter tumescens TaxID=60443 RepID=A0ABQ2HXQ1_9MICO|nr:hypothetical protein GCM10009721_18350 [Terrabacter tumescens]